MAGAGTVLPGWCVIFGDFRISTLQKYNCRAILFISKFFFNRFVTSELSKENNFWLKNLTNNLYKREEAEEIFDDKNKCHSIGA